MGRGSFIWPVCSSSMWGEAVSLIWPVCSSSMWGGAVSSGQCVVLTCGEGGQCVVLACGEGQFHLASV